MELREKYSLEKQCRSTGFIHSLTPRIYTEYFLRARSYAEHPAAHGTDENPSPNKLTGGSSLSVLEDGHIGILFTSIRV